jgi:hypothetical protein
VDKLEQEGYAEYKKLFANKLGRVRK